MAGFLEHIIETGHFKTNSYIDELLEKAEKNYGKKSSEYNGIFNQYYKIPQGDSSLKNRRHYEAEVFGNNIPKGLERLYKRSVVINLLSSCSAECVYCLRGYYNKFVLANDEIKDIATYCASNQDIKEVLITGGDPFIASVKLKFLITALASKAPNIKFIRIGTRILVQDPFRFDTTFFSFFNAFKGRFIFEIGLQVNHYFEIQEKTIEIIKLLQESNCIIYSQNVLLKDVNDNLKTLIRLYDELRYIGVLPHYLFHAVPMIGTDNFRTTVQTGIDLINQLTSSGHISGRAKPQFALMTDIGKVILYHNSIMKRDGKFLLIKTNYTLSEREQWNPSYKLPETAIINTDNTLSVKYLDAE